MTPVIPILTAVEMRAAEQAVFDSGVSDYALMERAATAAAEIIWRAGAMRDALVLCGPGNNGGDGFVIARLLRERGVPVRVAAMGESSTPSSQTARAAWNGAVESIAEVAPAAQLIDALFGTGLTRGLDPTLAGRLGALVDAAGHSYAIDLPSGVHTDTGACLSAVPHFDLCIAVGALKPAHVLRPAAGCFDRLVCADIGIGAPNARTHRLPAPDFPAPLADVHKYSRGLVAILGGAMPGATALSAAAAARSGAGYVRLMSDGSSLLLPHAVVRARGDVAAVFADARIRAILAGPGLGRDTAARVSLEAALAQGHPAVIDADALLILKDAGFGIVPPIAVLTPHEGEFHALFGALEGSRIDRVRIAAKTALAVVILKGADTVIAGPDGRVCVAPSASSWLSTAGTGDVLAGICAARLAVTGDAFRAASEAVWLHGEIARRAGAAFAADDLIPFLPAAIASRS
jgi:hydroxyethylthiazole kinase-like uncharacterized protein yjeF